LLFSNNSGKGLIVKKISTALLFTILTLAAFSNNVWAEDDDVVKALKAKCNENNSRACYLLGQRARTVDMDNKAALAFYIKACDLDDIESCNVAGILTQQKGLQYSKHWKAAFKLYDKACQAKHKFACANIGSLKYREGRQKAAIKYYKMACDLGNRIGCDNTTRLKR